MFKKAATLDPDDANAHYGLGLVYTRQEKYNEAAAEFARAIELAPDMLMARERLKAIRREHGVSEQ